MTAAMKSLMKFADVVWHNRTKIREAQYPVNAIYAYYNHGHLKTMPNWRATLQAPIFPFGNTCSNVEFDIQGRGLHLTGEEIGDAFQRLHDFAALHPLESAGRREKDRKHFIDSAAEKFPKEIDNWAIRNLPTANPHTDAFNRGILAALRTEAQTCVRSNPALLLGAFIYFTGDRASADATYRIYVTPKLQAAPTVFCKMVNFMNGGTAPSELPLESKKVRPREGKYSVPGPEGAVRSDRIVIYCGSELEMNSGVDWLRWYQSRHAGEFDNLTPLGTKPVDGLKGVAVTPQPTPDANWFAQRGLHDVEGVSFGITRAVVLAEALDGATSLSQFKRRIGQIGPQAGLDLGLANLAVRRAA